MALLRLSCPEQGTSVRVLIFFRGPLALAFGDAQLRLNAQTRAEYGRGTPGVRQRVFTRSNRSRHSRAAITKPQLIVSLLA